MGSEPMQRVVHGPRIMGFFDALFETPARSYDFIWLRHQPPSHGIPPHCDTVFMGRGTPEVLTAWIPFGDIPIRAGGLMVLENSHKPLATSASPTTSSRTSTATARTVRTPTSRHDAAR